MARSKRSQQDLLDKILRLSPEKVAEVEDFVDFLHQREEERATLQAVTRASESTFAKAWDNPDDAEYDRL